MINLSKFVNFFRVGFYLVNLAVFRNRAVWFANRDKTFDRFIRFFATRCGEFSSTFYWIRGMVSNYRYVSMAGNFLVHFNNLAKSRKELLMDFNFQQ